MKEAETDATRKIQLVPIEIQKVVLKKVVLKLAKILKNRL